MEPRAAEAISGSAQELAADLVAALERTKAALAVLRAIPAGDRAALAAFDALTGELSDASARASVARSAHPAAEVRDRAEALEQELDSLATQIALDRAVYGSLQAIDEGALDAEDAYYLGRILRDFRRAGVDRDEATRARVKALNEELVVLGQTFARNLRDDVRFIEVPPGELAGLPKDYIQAHAADPKTGLVRITTDYPDYVPFMTYAESRGAREALWRVYRQRGHPQNGSVLAELLARRHELANLLGFPAWAEYATADKMIGSASAAAVFIEQISQASQSRAQADYQELLALLRQREPTASEVLPWDAEVLKEQLRAERCGFSSQSVRPYFELFAVQRGLLQLTEQLFGVRSVPAVGAKVWHPDVSAWDVFEGGVRVGRYYLDLFPRDGKYKHAAQFTLASGQKGKHLPEAALICNFSPPKEGAPALLEHSEVVTFFHEFGHLLHHLLGGHTRWAGVSGVRTEWDFVEAPSQMLEEWCWDPQVLSGFARHHQTGEPIPAELVARMRAAEELGKGLRVRQQMFYAAVSLELHRREPSSLDASALVDELQRRYTPFAPVAGTYMHESFGHLEGYSALYYTYMWSLVIAKDLFGEFRREGLLSGSVAQRYRRTILAPGGGKPAAQLVRDFLGRDFSFSAYRAWLDA